MKRLFKCNLSIFLAITIIFSSAYAGFSEVDFISLFAIKSDAVSESVLEFELNGDGDSYSITDCDYNVEGKLVIPDTYNGLPVTSISEGAFYGCENLISVTVPDSVTSLGDYSFSNCEALVEILLPDSLENIGEMAFVGTGYYCDNNNWKNGVLYLDNCLLSGNSSISVFNMGMDGENCFEYDYAPDFSDTIVEAYVKDDTKLISNNAFCGCWNLKSITLPDSVKRINYMAFAYCDDLRYVFYLGTEADRNNIIIDNRNEGIDSAIWHYESIDHTAGEWIVDKKATCKESGNQHKECTICDEMLETEIIPTAAHCSDIWIIDSTANCVNNGLKHKVCYECGTIFVIEAIHAKGHKAGSWQTTKKATVTAAGKKVKKCTECGEVLETATIKQLKCSKPELSKIENTAEGVKVTWSKVSGADKYYVYRKTSSGSYSRIGSTTKTYYIDKTAKSGKKYYYIVKAINEAGSSSSSSVKSIYHLADTTLKTPSSTKSGVKLSWKKVTGAEGYQVWRKTGSGSYSKIATVKGNSKVTYTDKSAKKGKTYTYKIKAYKSKTTSAYSNAKKIKDKY